MIPTKKFVITKEDLNVIKAGQLLHIHEGHEHYILSKELKKIWYSHVDSNQHHIVGEFGLATIYVQQSLVEESISLI